MREPLMMMLYASFFPLYYFLLRGTVFQVSIRRNFYGGVLMIREVFLLILLGVVVFELYGVYPFKTVYVTEFSLRDTGPIVFFCVGLLLASVSLFSKTVFRTYLTISFPGQADSTISGVEGRQLIRATSLILLLVIGLGHYSGMNHAFISALTSGDTLIFVRLANKYESSAPPHVVTYMRYAFLLQAILLGVYGSASLNRVEKFFHALLVVYAASLPGDKAPVLQVLLFFVIGHVYSHQYAPNRVAIIFGFSAVIMAGLIYGLALVQYPDMTADDFMIFLADRLGIGQIQGVYEQFALQIQDWRYVFTEIPLSGIFGDGKGFSKDLMMATFGYYAHENDIGVMNSFFIGEALAIGGWFLVFVSPLIVAFNFCFISSIIVWIFVIKFDLGVRNAKLIAPLFASSILMFTGDFNGLLFGKKVFVVIAFMFALYFVQQLLNSLSRGRMSV